MATEVNVLARKVCTSILENWLRKGYYQPAETCENYWNDEDDVSPCSHFDHCERPATIWVYESDDGTSLIYGFCDLCYDYCFPYDGWYRVVKVSPDFKGVLK